MSKIVTVALKAKAKAWTFEAKAISCASVCLSVYLSVRMSRDWWRSGFIASAVRAALTIVRDITRAERSQLSAWSGPEIVMVSCRHIRQVAASCNGARGKAWWAISQCFTALLQSDNARAVYIHEMFQIISVTATARVYCVRSVLQLILCLRQPTTAYQYQLSVSLPRSLLL